MARVSSIRGLSSRMTRDTTSQSFFEMKYKKCEDPWSFATSRYEQERYAAVLSATGDRRYRRAFEPGCSIGVLTARLAQICDFVEAMDISPTAIALARDRTKHLHNVRTTCGALPSLLPSGNFDLIVFSEVGYYFTEDDLFAVATSLNDRICKSGEFLAVHWLGESPDHLLSGDRVHEILDEIPTLVLRHRERHANFRLDVWTRK
jgi:SAM-dependent methyltransferase